ncbi:MAG: serine/threonine-protein kinase [Planctomycetota bacterium]
MSSPTNESLEVDDDDAFVRHLESALDAVAGTSSGLDASCWRLLCRDVPASMHNDLLIELIKAEMARHADDGRCPAIDHYHDLLAECGSDKSIPLSLVLEERQLRHEHGFTVIPGEYERRFPQWRNHFGELAGPSVVTASEETLDAPGAGPIRPSVSTRRIDDFELLQPLGSGAFAEVHLARQISMQRLVALKLSHSGIGESQTLARFDHPNIVRVFDQRHVNAEQIHLIYMQFLPGGTLADVVRMIREIPISERNGGHLLESVDRCLLRTAQQVPERSAVREWLRDASWPAVVSWIGVQLSTALHAAHVRGVLHRDVKPANVLLTAEGIPKLADFNVSMATPTVPDDGDDTIGGSLGGSIGYMSPEHLNAIMRRDADPTSVAEPADLYSMAVMLWELWQGHRPFDVDHSSDQRVHLLKSQLAARSAPLIEPERDGSAAERSLEKTLRQSLTPDSADRVGSGNELAARLRLSLHPEAAEIFDPGEHHWRHRLGQWSPWLVAPLIILLPNIAAGVFNFAYNQREIIDNHEGMADGFEWLANTVNSIAFPAGAVLIIIFAWPVAEAQHRATAGQMVSHLAISRTLQLCRRAAWIGGALWLIAAVVYPVTLSRWYPQFTISDAVHFFMSLLICGGVAMAYPFFGLALLSTWVYYPRLVRRTLIDPRFDDRGERLRRVSGRFLLTAAGVPLMGLAMLLSRTSMTKDIVAASVAATALGLVGTWWAYQTIWSNWHCMADVLSRDRGRSIPGTEVSLTDVALTNRTGEQSSDFC